MFNICVAFNYLRPVVLVAYSHVSSIDTPRFFTSRLWVRGVFCNTGRRVQGDPCGRISLRSDRCKGSLFMPREKVLFL